MDGSDLEEGASYPVVLTQRVLWRNIWAKPGMRGIVHVGKALVFDYGNGWTTHIMRDEFRLLSALELLAETAE